jgi:hypothetical protein
MEIKQFVVYSDNRKELDELHKLAINNGFTDDKGWNSHHAGENYTFLYFNTKGVIGFYSHNCNPAKLYNLQSQKEEIYNLIGIKTEEMKSYQFVKSLNSYSVGDILTPEVKNIDVSGLKISIEALLQQGFIKEYKELEFKAGDYITGTWGDDVRKIIECKIKRGNLTWTQEEFDGTASSPLQHSWKLSKIKKASESQVQEWLKKQKEYKDLVKIYGYDVQFNLDNTVTVGCKKYIDKKYLESMLLIAEFCQGYEVSMSFNESSEILINDSEDDNYDSISKVVQKLK